MTDPGKDVRPADCGDTHADALFDNEPDAHLQIQWLDVTSCPAPTGHDVCDPLPCDLY